MTVRTVRFIWGPFDGYSQSVSDQTDLAAVVALPLHENVWRMLDGKAKGPASSVKRVAVYRRQLGNADITYVYVDSQLAQDLKITDMKA